MKRIFAIAMLLSLTLSLSLFPSAAETSDSGQIDQLTVAIGSDQGPLTPFSGCSTKSWELHGLVYDNLYEMDTHRVLQPSLATSYEVSEDYTVYTFHLRDDVKWHDGEQFTSEDVKFSYELAANVVNSVNFTAPAQTIQTINTPDPYTVEFVFEEPRSEEIMDILFGYMPIVAEHVYAGLTNDEIAANTALAIGTGPYKVVDMKPEEYYHLEANEEYFGGTPVAKELIMPVILDRNSAMTALKAHQIDAMAAEIPAEMMDQFRSDDSLAVLEGTGFSSTLLFLNESRAPFDVKEVRQAISYAINTQELVDVILLGRGTVASPGFVNPNDKLYNPETPAHEYNPEKAKELLDQVGFVDVDGDGFRENEEGEPVALEILVSSSKSTTIRAAELIGEYLGEIGLNAKSTVLESGMLDTLVAPNWDGVEDGDYDMCLWGWGDVFMTTPARYVEQFHSDPTYGPSNLTRIKEPEMDAILERIRTSLSFEERDKAVDEMQIYLADHVTMVPLYFADIGFAYDPSAFDGWKMTDGRGIVTKRSLVYMNDLGTDDQAADQPASSTGDQSSTEPEYTQSKGNNTGIFIFAGVIVVAIIVIVVLTKKKKK